MEYNWSRHYRRIRSRRRNEGDEDKMEALPYFVRETRYFKLERENEKLRDILGIALIKTKNYRKENDGLLEETEDLKTDIEEQNEEFLYLEENIEILKYDKRELSERNRQLEEINYHLHQQLTQTKQREQFSLGSTIESLEWKIFDLKLEAEHHDRELKGLKQMIKDKSAELQKYMKENDNQACILQETLMEKEELIRSLKDKIWNHEREVRKRNINITDQDKMYEREKAEIIEANKRQEKCKDDQNFDLRYQLQQTKADIISREKKIQYLERNHGRELERNNKRVRQMKKDLEEKDNLILDLEEQLKKSTKTEHQSQSEKDKCTESLKRKIQKLETEIQILDPKVKYQKEDLSRQKIELTQMRERIKVLENTVNVKDDQLIKAEVQLQQSMKTLREKEKEKEEIVTPQNKRVQHLEIEIKRRDLKIRDLEAMLEREKQESTKDGNAKSKDMRDKEDRITELKDELQHNLTNAQKTEALLRDNISSLQKKNQHLEKKVLRCEPAGNEVNERQIKNDLKEKDDLISKLKDQLQKAEKFMHQPHPETEELVRSLKKKIQQLDAEVESLKRKVKHKEAELDDTKTRLSKAMGNRLTDNNPNITDLSDKNRPTKLAERYAELYDNQWTDAFDSLQKHFHTEEKVIQSLLQILQNAMHFCRTKGHEQLQDLQHVLKFSRKNEDDIPADIRKLIKDCRKAMSSAAVRNLWEMYLSDLRQSTDEVSRTALSVSSFTEECIEISWFMMVQDPPVVFAHFVTHGDKLNTDLFKPYTSSGTLVDYMVWPALLLHEGGPVLAKGVAQGYGKKST